MSDTPQPLEPTGDQVGSPASAPTPDASIEVTSPVVPGSPVPAPEPQPIDAAEAAPAEGVATATEPAPAGEAAATAVPPATIFKGRVTRVTNEQVFVDLEDSRKGYVPLIEFIAQRLPVEGDEVSVIIDREEPETGLLALSKRGADEQTFWDSVQPGDVIEGVVTGMNKGGLDIDIGGARAFLPASQVDIQKIRDISVLIGEHVRCAVSQVDRTTRDLIVSRRKLMERERRQKRREMIDALVEGEVRTGTVSSLTEYGAFVDLGGVDGLVHISDLSWGRVKDPREVVQEGQELQVRILKVDRQKGKVSLGVKQTQPDPWEAAAQKYPEGSRLRAKVARLADFGAFLELEPGIDALLPISEMSWSRRIGNPADFVKPGDEIEVAVLKVDPARKRISVGLRQTTENPWANVETRYPIDSMVHGKVSKVMDYGAFVEVAPGVEGLIHISELSDRRVKAVDDVVKEGQEVDARVIKIDPEAQRISLSLRPKPQPRHAPVEDTRPGKKRPERKKPLRGGLSSHFDWFKSLVRCQWSVVSC